MTTNEMTPADLSAVIGGNNDGFGGGNGAWWLIVLFIFAIFGGWGNGFGGNGGGNGGAYENYVLASDFATLQRQLDSATDRLAQQGVQISNGLCDGFYAMNTSLLNGFSGVNNAINTNGYETRNAITNAQINAMQNTNAIQTQLAQCCCDNKSAIADLNYNIATQSCATNNNVSNSARDIIDSQNANTRAILEALQAQQTEALKTRIAEQAQQINALQLAKSQTEQNAYLLGQLKQCPIPAYTVPNPYANTCANTCGYCNA